MPKKVPIEGEVFWGSKGIITLGESFNSSSSFSVEYGTSGASFSLVSQGKEEVKKVSSQKKEKGEQKSEPPNSREGITESGPQIGSSGAGEGIALLASLATLLSMTFSLLG